MEFSGYGPSLGTGEHALFEIRFSRALDLDVDKNPLLPAVLAEDLDELVGVACMRDYQEALNSVTKRHCEERSDEAISLWK